MRRFLDVLPTALAALAAACANPPAPPAPMVSDLTQPPRLEEQTSGTSALLQAVAIVDSNVVWISGHEATVLRTVDGGRTWLRRPVPAPDSLQFRDVHAFSADVAYLLAAGPGDMSRVYRTDDGGATWTLQWTNPEAAGFYDCFDFWTVDRGLLYGDAVDGQLRILTTDDGGRTWLRVPNDALPPALPGEGGFAASGLCVHAGDAGKAWIAAGNAERARVFRTADYGRTWADADVPVETGPGAGLTAIGFGGAAHDLGIAFGGNLAVTDRHTSNVAYTRDGGATWAPLPTRAPTSPGTVSFEGAIYGGIHSPFGIALAVGPGGAAVCLPEANAVRCDWTTVDERAWWGLDFLAPDAAWIAGPEGRIARLRWLQSTSD